VEMLPTGEFVRGSTARAGGELMVRKVRAVGRIKNLAQVAQLLSRLGICCPTICIIQGPELL